MSVNFNSDVYSVSNYHTPVANSTPLPVVDPTLGEDSLQQQYLEALQELEQALNEAYSNPNNPYAAADVQKAAADLKVASDAIATSGTDDDKAMVTAFNSNVSQSPALNTIITDAEDPTKTVVDIENDMQVLVDPASWTNAVAALQHFQDGLPY